jgi:thymidylate synthase
MYNLITTIEEPCHLDSRWIADHSPSSVSMGADRIRDVIDTVFPIQLRARHTSRAELYADYMRVHRRAMRLRRNRSKWGAYFERLIAYNGQKNQLDTAIEKLLTWPRSTTGLVFHLSCPIVDAPRTRGGPCWHYGELLWRQGNVLDLVAVYRNHDFFNKALGNFIALGQLLRFIAEESEKLPGRLICHSIHAYSEGSLRALSQLAKI